MNQFDKACLTCQMSECDEVSLRCNRRRVRAAYMRKIKRAARLRQAELRAYQAMSTEKSRMRAILAMAAYQEAVETRCL